MLTLFHPGADPGATQSGRQEPQGTAESRGWSPPGNQGKMVGMAVFGRLKDLGVEGPGDRLQPARVPEFRTVSG